MGVQVFGFRGFPDDLAKNVCQPCTRTRPLRLGHRKAFVALADKLAGLGLMTVRTGSDLGFQQVFNPARWVCQTDGETDRSARARLKPGSVGSVAV